MILVNIIYLINTIYFMASVILCESTQSAKSNYILILYQLCTEWLQRWGLRWLLQRSFLLHLIFLNLSVVHVLIFCSRWFTSYLHQICATQHLNASSQLIWDLTYLCYTSSTSNSVWEYVLCKAQLVTYKLLSRGSIIMQ